MELPKEILQYVVFPNLYDKDILKYFIGDPESGNLILRDPINAPHLSLENQLYSIIQLKNVNKYFRSIILNPFNMTFTQKVQFAKRSLVNYPASCRIKRKLIYKIANHIKPSTIFTLYRYVRQSYANKIRILKYIVIQDIKRMRPTRFNYGNMKCIGCDKNLPYYQPSIKTNWDRAKNEGYNPKYLLKQACSKECLSKCRSQIMCGWCHRDCKPGTEFLHNMKILKYYSVSVNPITREASRIEEREHRYISPRLCSRECSKILNREHHTLCDKYFIVRSMNIENPNGFLINEEIIQDLINNFYTIRNRIIILNPNAPEFIGGL